MPLMLIIFRLPRRCLMPVSVCRYFRRHFLRRRY
jgi:hypothetical protein